MGIFDRMKEPVFPKESNDAEKELEQLRVIAVQKTAIFLEIL